MDKQNPPSPPHGIMTEVPIDGAGIYWVIGIVLLLLLVGGLLFFYFRDRRKESAQPTTAYLFGQKLYSLDLQGKQSEIFLVLSYGYRLILENQGQSGAMSQTMEELLAKHSDSPDAENFLRSCQDVIYRGKTLSKEEVSANYQWVLRQYEQVGEKIEA